MKQAQKRSRSYYDTLDIDSRASDREVTVAYRRICGFLSPETLASYNIHDPHEIEELKHEIDEAFWVLSDAKRRCEYDGYLASGTSSARAEQDRPRENGGARIDEPIKEQPPVAAHTKNESRAAPIAAPAPTPLPSVVDGFFLKSTRESQSLSLEQIAQLTKIGRHHLVAIESNEFSALPAEIYVRGFVQQMAMVLGLDPAQTSKGFINTFRGQRVRR